MRAFPCAEGPSPRPLAAVLALLLLLASAGGAAAQGGTISGTVVSEATQRPLPGAQVAAEGAGRATVTDATGRFQLAGLSGAQVTLRVTALGYRTETASVRVGETAVQVALAPQAVALDAVVVTGTPGGATRREIGNVVSQVQAAEVVERAPVANLQELINGRSPGVVIIPGSGNVGTGSRIRIRGIKSLSLGQEPLVYVDGVRVNNSQATGPINQGFQSASISRWNDFNPDDIESLEIIKGPAAATLYGTEAANGVIQIITKKGRAGTPVWSFTTRQGSNWFANPENRLWTNYARVGTGASATIQELTMEDFFRQEEERGTPIFTTGRMQDYDLNVSGGSSAVRYFIGGNVERNVGIEENNRVKRWGGRANLSIFPSETFDAVASLGYVNSYISLPLEAGGGGTLWSTAFANPANLTTPRRGFHSATPAAYRYAYQDWQDLDRFTGSLQLNHRPTGWFSHRLSVGTDVTLEDNQELVQRIDDPEMAFFFSASEIRGYKEIYSHRVHFNTLDWSGTAKYDLRPGLTANTSVGAQFYRAAYDTVYTRGEDFPVRGLQAIRSATTVRTADNYLSNTTVGVFAQQQIGWNDRFFLTGAVRADDNSAFGQEFDLVYYPKLSAAWVLSEEPFFGVPGVSTLRLRGAYGQSGQQPQAFASLRTFKAIPGPNDVSAVIPEAIGNPELGPERGEEIELGFDAGFLDERLGLELTYYNQRTNDAILLSDIAPSTGFAGQQFINAGEIANSGFEILARASLLNRERLSWDVQLSLATNENEVVDLGVAGLTRVSAGSFVQHREGYPVGAWFERRVLDAQFSAAGALVPNSEICDDGSGGRMSCIGADGRNGTADDAPLVYLGRPTPANEGAFTSTLTLFGNLRLYGMLDFKTGYKKMDGNLRVRCYLFLRCRENFYPQEFTGDPAWLAEVQRGGVFVSRLINDSGFARLRELSASYSLPEAWARRVGGNAVTLTVAGRNLYTWTDYTGLEPEASFLGGSRGTGSAQWEQNVLPQLQQFVATLNVRF